MFFLVSEMLLLIVALSIDIFTAGFVYGADRVRIPALSAVIVALISDVFLIVSLMIGNWFRGGISPDVTRVLSFLILFVLGVMKVFDSSIRKRIRDNRFGRRELHMSFHCLRFILTVYARPEEANTTDKEVLSPSEAVSLGLALSLDSAAAGLGAATQAYSLPLTALSAFLISIGAVCGGCKLGQKLSAKSDINFSMIGGVLLLILAFSKLL